MGIMVPKSIAMFLRPYQEEGVRFFWERYKEGRGGVLGDDMGLGKTIQVISFLAAIMRKSGDQSDEKRRYKYIDGLLNDVGMKGLPPANSKWPTCLIIAPRPLVGNWERELLMWGYFETGIYLGSNEERDNVLRNFKMGRLDILLTSHESAQQHINLLDDLKLSCVFVDEAHKIKNEKTKTFEAYMQFACQVRFGLSGTVIQNSYSEMWPLLTWSNPGRLGTKDQWEQTIARPLKEGQSKNATDKEHAEFAELADRFVKRLMPKFFLRRTKDIIKDQLPKKIDKVVFCPLTKTQIEVYKRFLATEDVQLMLRKDEPCQCGSKKTRGRCCYKANAEGVPWKNLMFTYIDIFIKISNSLLLIYPGPTDESEQVKRNRDLLKIAFPGRNPGTYTMVLHNKELCGKWDVLSRLLKVWYDEGAGNKVLIFSKSLKLLEFLTYSLEQEGTNFRKLDGKTKQDERYRNIDEFNLDPKVFVFLISTKVGGTGLNLIAANKVSKSE
ncbi:hypothetical protein FRC03_001782 [Tulasnella sp. 419]|nr:hypothetical protein FRC03_001782 [Tulasnella sp. 419]